MSAGQVRNEVLAVRPASSSVLTLEHSTPLRPTEEWINAWLHFYQARRSATLANWVSRIFEVLILILSAVPFLAVSDYLKSVVTAPPLLKSLLIQTFMLILVLVIALPLMPIFRWASDKIWAFSYGFAAQLLVRGDFEIPTKEEVQKACAFCVPLDGVAKEYLRRMSTTP